MARRRPYVHDEDLARAYRRSAQIDREEADCYDLDDPRLQACLDSAIEFDELADEEVGR
jgi:hypothetical protein